ncbi:MAG: hypothetical protein VB055_01075 [Oscillospiraceae bacterium]|nr:hypothetical protein [Oscillospiraceae bacterium]
MAEQKHSVSGVLRAALLICFFLPVALLTMFGLFSVCHITEKASEVHYFVAASALPPILCFLLFLVLLLVCRRFGAARTLGARGVPVTKALLLLLCALGTAFVLAAQVSPGADQGKAFLIAAKWRAGNFSDLLQGGYLDEYPQQIGLILLYYGTSFVVGSYNVTFWQLCNVAALAGAVWCFARTAALFFPRRFMLPAVTGCCCLFLPLLFYTAFNYGTLYGFFCSMAAFYQLARFLEDRKWRRTIEMALLAALAVLLKQNYLISLAAMAVILLLHLLKTRDFRALAALLLLPAAYWLLSSAASFAVETLSGLPLAEGIPRSTWILMGLEESGRGPGWYKQSVVDLYAQSGYDAAATDAVAKAAIRAQLELYAAHPGYALRFFARKIASQWNEPTFQCFWISSVRSSFSDSPLLIRQLLTGLPSLWMEAYLRVYELTILLGTLGFLLFRRKRASAASLLFAVTFLGGFLFHLVWEAKGQYTFLYFVLLLPYAVEGWSGVAAVPDFVRGLRATADKRQMLRRGWRTLLVLVLLAALLLHPGFARNTLGLSGDEASYADARAERLTSVTAQEPG